MSSVPSEVLLDVLLPLDRWTLDAAQFTDGRFLQLVMERMSDVCLRKISFALFQAPTGISFISAEGHPERNGTRPFADFVQALRSSYIASLFLNGFDFTPELAALVLQTPIFTGALSFSGGSFAELTPTQFHNVLMRFEPTSLSINGCPTRAGHVTDGLLRALSEKGMRRAKFPNMVPVDGGSFHITDDAVVDFCLQDDVHSDEEGDAPVDGPFGKLEVYKGNFTKELFKRLVEACSVSKRTQPLQISVCPLRFEDEDLREFAQHLSYGQPWHPRIYNFPGEQQGAIAGMDLQIVLYTEKLELIRAQRPNPLFHESDE